MLKSRGSFVQSWPEEGWVHTTSAVEGGVLEVLRCVLVRVLPRKREDLLVGRNEIGHPSNCTVQFFQLSKNHVSVIINLCALLWSIWLSRNDVVFHNTKKQTVLQILFRATYLTRT